jgi:paraquat-inducible protein B
LTDTTPATVDWSQQPVQLPTVPGQLQATEETVENILKKVDKMPLQEIGDNLNKAIANLNLTLVTARGALDSTNSMVSNANHLVGPNSMQAQELDTTLQAVAGAASSVRVLADYLERHPETLIRGKKGEAK